MISAISTGPVIESADEGLNELLKRFCEAEMGHIWTSGDET